MVVFDKSCNRCALPDSESQREQQQQQQQQQQELSQATEYSTDTVAMADKVGDVLMDAVGNSSVNVDIDEGPLVKRQRLDEGPPTTSNAAGDARIAKNLYNEQWDEMLERLRAYRAQYGDCLVPKRFPPDQKLGTWETQRVQFRRLPRVYDEILGCEVPQPNKRLTAERLHKLSELGFCWSAKEAHNTGSTGSLVSFLAPPTTTPTLMPTSASTAIMVPQTITLLPKNSVAVRASPLTHRSASDVSVGYTSVSKSNSEEQWEDYYEKLKHFKATYGHVIVPRKYDADPKLASWVENQRALWNRDFNQSKDRNNTVTSPVHTNADHYLSPNKGQLHTARHLTQERKEKLDALGFVWSLRSKRIDDHWDEMFKQLLDYKNQHGDCRVPSRYEPNLKLGKWVETQRYEYTKARRAAALNNDGAVQLPNTDCCSLRPLITRLTTERQARLESIGFEWKVKNKMKRHYDKQWDSMFQKLLEFRQKYGHVNVPKRFPENIKLGTWVHTQRIQYRKLMAGNSQVHSNAKTQSESTINGDDQGPCPSDAYTEETYEGGPSSWTPEQAQSYRLTDERRKRLEDVGFCWSAKEGNEKSVLEQSGRITRNSYDDQWDAMFDLLVQYKEQNGDCLVPKRYVANPRLGTWVDTQRVQYKKWLRKIAQLQHRKEIAHERQRDQIIDDNISIGSTGKDSLSNTGVPLVGRLTQERIQRLQNLGFVWSLRDDWAKHYEELKAYKQIHGHCNVPARYAENKRLGVWVSAQRQQFKILQQQILHSNEHRDVCPCPTDVDGLTESFCSSNNDANGTNNSGNNAKVRRPAALTQERIDLLNALGFTWTIRSRDSLGESWNQRLNELRMFKEQYGHCLVPSRYEANPELGAWVGAQRTQYRNFMRSKESGVSTSMSINEDRIKQLEELSFVWALRGASQEEMFTGSQNSSVAEISDRVVAQMVLETGQDENTDYNVDQNQQMVFHPANPIDSGANSEHSSANAKSCGEFVVTI